MKVVEPVLGWCFSLATSRSVVFLPYGLPGAGRFAAASSMTNTESFESGGVKFLLPKVAKVPIKVVAPEEGLNHQQVARLMPLEIFDMFNVSVARLPFGT